MKTARAEKTNELPVERIKEVPAETIQEVPVAEADVRGGEIRRAGTGRKVASSTASAAFRMKGQVASTRACEAKNASARRDDEDAAS